MTSTSTIRTQEPQLEGRTVRDVVEYRHELVNEVWCRKILRHVLQSLELQYSAGMPHRAITPDTIVIQENGEPMLLPSERKAAQTGIPADLHALACVIHYAITLELAPGGPLRGRALAGYSDSLIGAIDKCLDPDPARRPQTIDELRNLLGIVSLGSPAVVAPARAEPAPAAAVQRGPAVRSRAPLGKLQRWLLIGLAALVLLAAVIALLTLLRGTAARDAVVLTLPPQGEPAADPGAMPPPAQPQAAGLPSAAGPLAAETASAAQSPTADSPPAAAPAPAQPAPAAAPPVRPSGPAPQASSRAAPAHAATPAVTSYKLVIKPWANVYVDGVERGVSPPLKRLSLGAGQHTVRLVNPNFPDRVIKVDAGRSQYGTIVFNFAPR